MGRIVKVSSCPQPFKHVPIKPAAQPQEPGEVLIGYELEVVDGCQLSRLGWCCFAALACTAFPFCWLPFVCDECRKKQQRPVYGYPMQSVSFLAPDTAQDPAKPADIEMATAPAILCMDSTMEQQNMPQLDQQQLRYPPQPRSPLPSSPSPPPISIFVPPSAVPACGFTPDNPFPSRYSPVPASPKGVAALGLHSPLRAASPAGIGLTVMGGQTLGAAS